MANLAKSSKLLQISAMLTGLLCHSRPPAHLMDNRSRSRLIRLKPSLSISNLIQPLSRNQNPLERNRGNYDEANKSYFFTVFTRSRATNAHLLCGDGSAE